ncbi:Glycosyl transferase 4-like domain-containing protein [Algoriphagus ornithinivorans]|uniref:Glycosyl transferase 4-like domain-containing protein n=1 Tax=Algoriphagus ornithinivorans TaxID=226506 RepID=A0A1I5JN08_9BACT|nr:glycosyltransferase family 4 protein [Algoriphagus ornithinivorans]SFO74090.1 Glycosyl transferase 4-like domain-containing protein [Algoriphagus ornithinivorans]
MRILFISDNFPPEINAPANRTYEHCKEWVKLGAEVTVITCAPNFPKGKVFYGYKNKWRSEEIIDGIRVIRVWSYITANEGMLRRILDYISFGISSFLQGLFIKSDIVIGTSPQFFSAMSAWQISLFTRRPWVMEVRDLWPESIIAVGAMKNKRIISFLEWIEMMMYRSANKIIVVTDTFKVKLSERGVKADKISVFKNGVDLGKYWPQPKSEKLISKYSLQGKFILAYIGTHGMAHGLDFILEQARLIHDELKNVHFLFIGDGANKENLVKKAENYRLENVTFLESVPKKEVLEYLNLMDIALVNLKKSDTFLTVIPSKIFEAAAVEKPILLGLEGETKGIIQKYGAGICFEPENAIQFRESVKAMYNKRENLSEYKRGCKKLAIDFERKKIAKSMLESLKEVG